MNQSVEDAIGHGLTFLILGRSDYHKQFRHLSFVRVTRHLLAQSLQHGTPEEANVANLTRAKSIADLTDPTCACYI